MFYPDIAADTVVSFNPDHNAISLDHFVHALTVQQLQSLGTGGTHGVVVVDCANHGSINLPGMSAG